jgi:iron complex outermembrane recepter protein
MTRKSRMGGGVIRRAISLSACVLLAPIRVWSAPDATATDQSGLQEIVVTAQRREERNQDVPISISVATSAILQSKGVTETTDLEFVAPSLVITNQVQAPIFVLRGIGAQYASPGTEQPVALYVDGFYSPDASAALFELNNVDRVEVLKGPQGTLFGRNATGGLIQVVTKDPTQESNGNISLGYGNYDTRTVSTYGTTGITDALSADIAFVGSWQGDGYGRNLFTGAEVNKTQQVAVRSVWLWTPSHDTTLRLSLDYANDRTTEGLTGQPIPGSHTIVGSSYPGNIQDTESNYPNYAAEQQYGVGLKILHSLANFDFVSLTGFRDSKFPSQLDQDTSPVPLVNAILDGTTQSTTQEFQLLSTKQSQFKWIAGLYYFHSSAGYDPLGISGLALGSLNTTLSQFDDQKANSYAAYGQGTYEVTDATQLTLGGRYTDEKHTMQAHSLIDGFIVPGLNVDSEKSYRDPSWRVSLDHHFSHDLMGYFSVNRGFKAGGYSAGTPGDPPTQPEILTAYELGVKSDLLNNRLRINSSAFYYDYKDMQIVVVDSGVSHLINAASSKIYGLDSEVEISPTDGLILSANATYLHATYSNFPGAPLTTPLPTGGNELSLFNAKGNELSNAPRFSGSVLASYKWRSGIGQFDPSVAYWRTSTIFMNPDNRVAVSGYGLLNSTVGWQKSADSAWKVSLWAKNLTNKSYYTEQQSSAIGDLGYAGPPRTYGGSVAYRF